MRRARLVVSGELAQSKSTLEHALGAMHDGFLLLDAQDRVVAWNQRYVDLFPWLADTISVGTTVHSPPSCPAAARASRSGASAKLAPLSHLRAIRRCSGSAGGQLTAYGLLVHGATLSVVGFTMDKVEVRLSNLMAFDARALGNWGCPPEYYPAALDLVLDGEVQIAAFVEKRPLATINEVFAAVHRHEIRKRVVLVP